MSRRSLSVPNGRVAGAALALRGLAKQYAGATVVDALDLDVAAGEFLTLLGPSGSGKTTTLMMIAGFTPPSAGDVVLNGRAVTALAPERRNIGVVFQNYALFPHMTVQDNVAFPLKMRNVAKPDIARKVTAALHLVQLDGLGARLPRQLSGGQQQRVALARALVFEPDLLLMDEPLGALDKNLRSHMQFELRRMHATLGVTILYVTHDQEEALAMSDRIALMNGGRIAQLGSAEDLYERPHSRFVAEFIGETNVIEGSVTAPGMFVTAGGVRLPLHDGAAPADATLLVVRPERLALCGPADAQARFTGIVRGIVYVGNCTRYRVEVAGALLTVQMPNRRDGRRAALGEAVGIMLDPADARLLPG